MASLRIINGRWVYDYRVYGVRRRAGIGRANQITEEQARELVRALDEARHEAQVRQKAWATAQFTGEDAAPHEDGLRVARRHISAIARNARKSAKRRGLEYALTDAALLEMILESRGRCCISGVPFSDDDTTEHKRPFMPSIDRIESAKGYTHDNCRLVCVLVNAAMNEWGMRALERVALGMAAHVPPFRVMR